jgi:cytochrome c biogenesis protein CcdA/thioredoxin-related protein
MPSFIRAAGALLLFILPMFILAQEKAPVNIHTEQQRLDDSTVMLHFNVSIQKGIKLFQLQQRAEDALYSEISFDSNNAALISRKPTEEGSLRSEVDPALQAEIGFYTDSVRWMQAIHVQAGDSTVVKGSLRYMYKSGEEFLNGEETFAFYIRRGVSSAAAVQPAGTSIPASGSSAVSDRSLWWIFLAAFGGGLLALLTPCVYSMIPVTVSFFTKRSTDRREGIRNALLYAGSIVVIFTLLGFLITLIFGPAALNNLATNWIANLVFFVLFLVFGISFLGAFDINLPASWMNKTDSRAGTGNFMGIFFMALTLVLVSFSCTGPIIGNLLVLAAKGSYMGPLVGMLGFSIALALPFALFAFFPSKLNILGKAGGWLNAVKVTLGFLELALALKFLSNADLVKGWRLLDREVYIALWVVIFFLLGLYLLGKLKFHHDDELPKNDFGLPYLTVPRLFFAIASLSFSLYMVPGLWGAPLKAIGAFLPPLGTQDFILSSGDGKGRAHEGPAGSAPSGLPQPVKYYEKMRIYEPEVVVKYGMTTYFDYAEALAIAREQKKPLMIDFTGINCVNCRKMEAEVWSDPEVMRRLKENFVIVSLYVDVQDIDLPEDEQYRSAALGKKVTTLGDRNADLQVTRYQANSQPYYFFLDADEQRLVPDGYGYDPDISKFIRLLDTAVEQYRSGAGN